MLGHKLYFYGEIWINIPNYPCFSFLSGALGIVVCPEIVSVYLKIENYII